jgi:hypothetical protein
MVEAVEKVLKTKLIAYDASASSRHCLIASTLIHGACFTMLLHLGRIPLSSILSLSFSLCKRTFD